MKVTFNVNKHKYEGVIIEGFLYHNSTALYQRFGTKINGTHGYKYRLKLRNPNKNGVYTITSLHESIYIRPVKTLTKEQILKKKQEIEKKLQIKKKINKLTKILPKNLFGYNMKYGETQMIFGCGAVKVRYENLPELLEHFSSISNISERSRRVIREVYHRNISPDTIKENLSKLRDINNAISKGAKNNNS